MFCEATVIQFTRHSVNPSLFLYKTTKKTCIMECSRFCSGFMDPLSGGRSHTLSPTPLVSQWATKVFRHFAILEYLRPISPSTPRFYPLPPNNVGFHVSRTCFFPKQHLKGGWGVGLNVNRILNGISEMLQLALDSGNCLSYFCRSLQSTSNRCPFPSARSWVWKMTPRFLKEL